MRPRSVQTGFALTLLFSIMASFPAVLHAQGAFIPDNGYDFRVVHNLSIHGPDPDHLFLDLGSASDFRTFKIRVKPNVPLGPDNGPSAYYYLHEIAIDFDGNGTLDVITTQEMICSWTYPQPADGVRESHSIAMRLTFHDAQGRAIATRYTSIPITVYASPRVFHDVGGNVLVQLRDQSCSDRIPLLIVEGIDPGNEAFPDVYYANAEDLINTGLYPRGYEVFILNFASGGADIRLNAAILRQALEKIHQLSQDEQITVIGISMGGVIARYALADAEHHAEAHHVGLFVSYDSPQKMAHVNHQLQDQIKNATVANAGIGALQARLNCMAAKEMLEYNAYDPPVPPNVTGYEHASFYSELKALNGDGYPHQCVNVSISNGNYNASWPKSYVGQPLGEIRAYTDYLFWSNEWVMSGVVAEDYDCGSGSLNKLAARQMGGVDDFPKVPKLLDPYVPMVVSAYYEWEIFFDPVYMPTWSTLDLQSYGIDGEGNVSPLGTSKFDEVFVQAGPMYHGQFGTGSQNKILEWLGSTYALKMTSATVSTTALWPGGVADCAVGITGGQGSYTYNWEYRNVGYSVGDMPWTHFSAEAAPSVSVSSWYDRQVRVTVSDGVASVSDTLPCIANLSSSASPIATVAGWGVLPAGAGGTWTANAYQGQKCGDFTYEWRIRPYGSPTWSGVIGTLPTLMWPTYTSTATELQLKVFGAATGTTTRTIWQSPGPVTDLAPEALAPEEIWVTWTAPGVPGLTGQVTAYDARYGEVPINSDVAFYASTQVATGTPKSPGEWEELIISGLQCDQYYYIALKVQDESGAWSPISNVVHARTIAGGGCGGGGFALAPGGAAAGAVGVGDSESNLVAGDGAGSFTLNWQVAEAGGTLTVGCIPDVAGTEQSVLTRTAKSGQDSTLMTGLESRQWTTCGLALRSRDEQLILGEGWRPIGLAGSAVAADAGNEQYAIQGVSLTHDGLTEVLDATEWGSAFGGLAVGDNLRVEYAKTGVEATDSAVTAWLLLEGPAGTEPMLGRTPEPVEAVSTAPERLELRILGSRDTGSPVRFELGLPRPGLAKLEVIDVTGRRVCELVNGWRPEGRHAVTWGGRDGAGRQVSAGVYFCRLTWGHEQRAAKVLWGGAR